MRFGLAILTFVFGSGLVASVAEAACSGGLGRGWASGKGNGTLEMTTADKVCNVGYAAFINDATKARTPATQVKLTTAPKNGKIGATADGIVYTPNPGFRGSDKFCTTNSTPEMKGKSLRGCVTVTVK